jgi:hypothetical protein
MSNSDAETYQVPLINADSGDGWDVEVEAESPQEAIQKATEQADGQPHVAGSFIRANMEVDQ